MTVSSVIKAIFPVDRTGTSDEWYTPDDIMIKAQTVLGTIDLDPCSCVEANKIVKAKKFYTIEDDGLSKYWQGKIWLNPPRGTENKVSIQSIWCEKLIRHYINSDIESAMFIIRAVIGYDWFNSIWDRCPNVCFLRHRPAYYRGLIENTSNRDQITAAVFYLGDDIKKFQDTFRGSGYIFDGLSYRPRVIIEVKKE